MSVLSRTLLAFLKYGALSRALVVPKTQFAGPSHRSVSQTTTSARFVARWLGWKSKATPG